MKGICSFCINIIFSMSIKTVLYWAFLLAIATSACINPSEPEGACTKCEPAEFLIEGICYPKIRGCLVQQAGLVCAECQNGYVLSRQTCIREAVFLGLNGTDIPPVTLNDNILSPDDLRDRLAELYGAPLSRANSYLTEKRPQLKLADIKKVETLNMKTGNIVYIVYTLPNSSMDVTYIMRVNLIEQVTQIATGPTMRVPTDPVTADKVIRSALGNQFTDFSVYDVGISEDGEIYTFDYIDSNNNIKRVKVNKNDIATPSSIRNKLKITDLKISDLAAEQIVQRYSYLKDTPITKVQNLPDGLFVIFFGDSHYSVSVEFQGNRFIINQPVKIVRQDPITPPIDLPVIAGGYKTFTNLQDPRYLSALAFATQTFPEIIGAKVTRVASQVVAGTNFLINLQTKSGNKFQIKIYHDLQGQNRLLEASRNSANVYVDNYNYNSDPIFLDYYQLLKQRTNIVNIPPISSVSRLILGDLFTYKAIYSDREYSEFTYNVVTQQMKILSYTVDGENILDTITPELIQQATARSSAVLLESLIQGRPEIIGGKVSAFISNPPNYELTVTSSTGTYQAIIDDRLGKIMVTSFTKISEKTCYDISSDEILGNSKIRGIDEFLVEQFSLDDYLLNFVQENVQIDSSTLRFLYVNDRYMQIVITLSVQGQSARLVSAYLMNYGYGNLQPNEPEYKKFLNYLRNIDISGSRIPFYTEHNTTHSRAFYNDGRQTLEIVIDDRTGAGSLMKIQSKTKYLVPTGFNIANMLIPTLVDKKPPSKDLQQIDQIFNLGKTKFRAYLGDSVIVFAEKTDGYFNVMFYSPSNGYIRSRVLQMSSGSLLMDRIYLTQWKDEDFSQCKRFDANGKCYSCLDSQIEYQGECFKKMTGCLIQAGDLCVKCQVDYIRSDYKCQRDCSAFFSETTN